MKLVQVQLWFWLLLMLPSLQVQQSEQPVEITFEEPVSVEQKAIILVPAETLSVDQLNIDWKQIGQQKGWPENSDASFATSLALFPETDQVRLDFKLVNLTEETQLLQFGSGQLFEIFVENDWGEGVYQFSRHLDFTQAIIDKSLPKGEALSFSQVWSYTDNEGNLVPEGGYLVRVQILAGPAPSQGELTAEAQLVVAQVEGATDRRTGALLFESIHQGIGYQAVVQTDQWRREGLLSVQALVTNLTENPIPYTYWGGESKKGSVISLFSETRGYWRDVALDQKEPVIYIENRGMLPPGESLERQTSFYPSLAEYPAERMADRIALTVGYLDDRLRHHSRTFYFDLFLEMPDNQPKEA